MTSLLSFKIKTENAAFNLFPNPASNFITFTSDKIEEKEANFTIAAVNGAIVQRFSCNLIKNTSQQIDISELQSGTYFCTLYNRRGDILGTKQIVVVK
jgi:hypothetical protein